MAALSPLGVDPNAKSSHILLSYTDKHSSVYVDAPKGDVFLMTVQHAVMACGAFGRWADFQTQMRQLMERLGKWMDERREKVREAHLTVRGSGLLFLVVSKSEHYDGELEDSLTEIDIEIANDDDFNLIKMEVLAIPDSPEECTKSFLGPIHIGKAHA